MFISPQSPRFAGYHEFHGLRDNISSLLDTMNPRLAGSEWAARIRREMTEIMHDAEQKQGLTVDPSIAPIIFKLDGTHIVGITGQDTLEFTRYREDYNKDRKPPAIQGDVFDSFSKDKKLKDAKPFRHNVDEHIVYLSPREAQLLSDAERSGGSAIKKIPERQTTW